MRIKHYSLIGQSTVGFLVKIKMRSYFFWQFKNPSTFQVLIHPEIRTMSYHLPPFIQSLFLHTITQDAMNHATTLGSDFNDLKEH